MIAARVAITGDADSSSGRRAGVRNLADVERRWNNRAADEHVPNEHDSVVVMWPL
jgi:hypothetical protein